MEPDKKNIQEYKFADKSDTNCIFTPEEQHSAVYRHSETLNSYLLVSCAEDAEPKSNRLQLRTNPITFIELQPGVNVLTVDSYPDLKYGFKSESIFGDEIVEIDFSHFDGSDIVSMKEMFKGMDVRKITFGNFKAPKLIDAESAFANSGCDIEGYEAVVFDLSGVDFSSIENAKFMFEGVTVKTLKMNDENFASLRNAESMFKHAKIETLEINNVNFKSLENAKFMFNGAHINTLKMNNANFESLQNADSMFLHSNIKTIELRNANFKNLKSAKRMFVLPYKTDTLIFDGLKIGSTVKIDIEPHSPVTISLKGCSGSVIQTIKESVESYRKKRLKKYNDDIHPTYISDDNMANDNILNNESKKEAMKKWLELNPGKTDRDWLLEERCKTEDQREILTDIFTRCDVDDIKIASCLYLDEQCCWEFMRMDDSQKYFDILEPIHPISYKRAKILPETAFYGVCATRVQFDLSLFHKYYIDLDYDKEKIKDFSTPGEQWKYCIIEKLGDIPSKDADDLASLFIRSNSNLMETTPLYNLESSEFRNKLESEIKQKKYIKANGLDKIPPSSLRPGFTNTKIAYSLRSDIRQLTIGEFIEKITQSNVCKGGRLVISFIDIENNCLNFPDEAVSTINKLGEICSGYYDKTGIVYPDIIDSNKIINVCDPFQLVVARTRRHGTIPVLDIVPFEWDGYAFTAIVVDTVVKNGSCSKVRDWL
ncbi:MAG: DUF285 domain-containing protein [Muribaculaceae bacterium]|nr:DUF285 domain-containing protein [Muribaculaceae bacterium]